MNLAHTLIASLIMTAVLSSHGKAEEGLFLSDAARSDGTSFSDQLRSDAKGPVVLLNTFQVEEKDAEAFKAGWGKAAEVLRRQPGFISTTLHRPVGGSRLWVNSAIWESPAAFAAALATPEFKAAASSLKQAGFRRLYQADVTLGPTR